MCRSEAEGGRRCDCSSGKLRQSRDRARYAAKKAEVLGAAGGATGVLEAPGVQGAGGGEAAPAEPLDWPAAKTRINELRTQVEELLDRSSPAAIKEWVDAEKQMTKDLKAQGLPQSEIHDLVYDKFKKPPQPSDDAAEAETLAREAGRLLDAEIERRVGPPPERASDTEIAAVQARVDALAAKQSDAKDNYEAAEAADVDEATLAGLKKKWADVGKELRAADDERWALLHRDPDRAWRNAQAQAAKDVLSELREMGGDHPFHPKSQKPAVKAVNEALGCFPADWVARSAGEGEGLFLRHTKGRAHYAHRTTQKFNEVGKMPPMSYSCTAAPNEDFDEYVAQVSAKGAKVRTFGASGKMRNAKVLEVVSVNPGSRKVELLVDAGTGKKQVSYETVSVLTTDKTVDTTIHELSHRMEYTNPRLKRMESAFYWRRTRGEDGWTEETVPYNGAGDEMVRPDGFVDEYVGRDYGGSAYEVMSIGMEGVFAGDFGALRGVDVKRSDEDHRAFVLGVLATT